jgi:hypothetical protein
VFGADATRRRKRLADWPTALGESGLRELDAALLMDCCEAVWDRPLGVSLVRPRPKLRCLSFLLLLRFGVSGAASATGGDVGGTDGDVVMTVGGWSGCLGDMAVPESVDGVLEEW